MRLPGGRIITNNSLVSYSPRTNLTTSTSIVTLLHLYQSSTTGCLPREAFFYGYLARDFRMIKAGSERKTTLEDQTVLKNCGCCSLCRCFSRQAPFSNQSILSAKRSVHNKRHYVGFLAYFPIVQLPSDSTIRTRIEEKCARTLEFPFSTTRGKTPANSAQLRQGKRNMQGALLGEAITTS